MPKVPEKARVKSRANKLNSAKPEQDPGDVSPLRIDPKISDTLARSRKRLAQKNYVDLGDLRGNEEVTAITLPATDGTMFAFIDPKRKENGLLKGSDSKYLLDVNAHKILNVLSIAAKFQDMPATASWANVVENLTVELNINELGRKMGFTNMQNARKEIRRATLALFTNVLQIRTNKNDKYNGFYFSILDGVAFKNGKLLAIFSPLFIKTVTDHKSIVTFYPEALLSLRENAYRVGWKLSRWAYSDSQHFSQKKIGEKNFYTYRLQVQTLVRAIDLPDYTPTARNFSELDTSGQARAARSDGGNKWSLRTKEPLENALNEVEKSGIIKSWYYTRAKGETLTDSQLESINDSTITYKEWSELYIEYVWAFDTPLARKRSEELAPRASKRSS